MATPRSSLFNGWSVVSCLELYLIAFLKSMDVRYEFPGVSFTYMPINYIKYVHDFRLVVNCSGLLSTYFVHTLCDCPRINSEKIKIRFQMNSTYGVHMNLRTANLNVINQTKLHSYLFCLVVFVFVLLYCVLLFDKNLILGCLWPLVFVLNNILILGIWCSTTPHLPGCFCPWTFFENIGFNTVITDPFMSHLATQLGYSAGEFQALQLIVLVAFGVVD